MPLRQSLLIMITAAAFAFLSGGDSAFGANRAFSALANHDYVTAFKEFKILADKGDAPAQYNLAIMCKNGRGVPQDYAEAFRWYRMAADQGHVRAQSSVARMYYEGQGVKQDYVLSYMWATLAGTNGDPAASKLRDTVGALLAPEQLADAQRLAREWKPSITHVDEHK